VQEMIVYKVVKFFYLIILILALHQYKGLKQLIWLLKILKKYYKVINIISKLYTFLPLLYITEPPVVLNLESELLEASKAGELETVQRLLTAYPHIVNCRDLDGR